MADKGSTKTETVIGPDGKPFPVTVITKMGPGGATSIQVLGPDGKVMPLNFTFKLPEGFKVASPEGAPARAAPLEGGGLKKFFAERKPGEPGVPEEKSLNDLMNPGSKTGTTPGKTEAPAKVPEKKPYVGFTPRRTERQEGNTRIVTDEQSQGGKYVKTKESYYASPAAGMEERAKLSVDYKDGKAVGAIYFEHTENGVLKAVRQTHMTETGSVTQDWALNRATGKLSPVLGVERDKAGKVTEIQRPLQYDAQGRPTLIKATAGNGDLLGTITNVYGKDGQHLRIQTMLEGGNPVSKFTLTDKDGKQQVTKGGETIDPKSALGQFMDKPEVKSALMDLKRANETLFRTHDPTQEKRVPDALPLDSPDKLAQIGTENKGNKDDNKLLKLTEFPAANKAPNPATPTPGAGPPPAKLPVPGK